MPSKKKHTRAAQLQPQPQPTSDYDTDTAAVTDAAPSMAPIPNRTNTELNMLVLKRYVPDVERIISLAEYAQVYLYTETGQWLECAIAGTLFLCQLSGSEYPRYKLVILNRKSPDNFIIELVSAEDIEITAENIAIWIMSEDGTAKIWGLWVHCQPGVTPTRKEIMANAIQECAMRAEMGRANVAGLEEQQDYHEPEQEYRQPELYNLDGSHDAFAQGQNQTSAQQAPTQQVDLLSLFNKPSIAANQHVPNQSNEGYPGPASSQLQPARFTPNPDTEFFQSSNSPAAMQQQSQNLSQSNALLNLFNSAKKG